MRENEAQRLLASWERLGVICLGGQVLVRRDPVQYNPGTPPRRHRITNRRWRKLRARWIEACRRHQLAAGVAYDEVQYV